jgi:hypothetical protein
MNTQYLLSTCILEKASGSDLLPSTKLTKSQKKKLLYEQRKQQMRANRQEERQKRKLKRKERIEEIKSKGMIGTYILEDAG